MKVHVCHFREKFDILTLSYFDVFCLLVDRKKDIAKVVKIANSCRIQLPSTVCIYNNVEVDTTRRLSTEEVARSRKESWICQYYLTLQFHRILIFGFRIRSCEMEKRCWCTLVKYCWLLAEWKSGWCLPNSCSKNWNKILRIIFSSELAGWSRRAL